MCCMYDLGFSYFIIFYILQVPVNNYVCIKRSHWLMRLTGKTVGWSDCDGRVHL